MPPEPQPSHAEIIARIDQNSRERDEFRAEVRGQLEAVARALSVVSNTLESVEDKLGEEPDSDGHGGRGLIGDMRKTARDLQGLVDLKNRGLGAVAAVALFGTLILWGIIYWVQRIVPAKVKTAAALLPWG